MIFSILTISILTIYHIGIFYKSYQYIFIDIEKIVKIEKIKELTSYIEEWVRVI